MPPTWSGSTTVYCSSLSLGRWSHRSGEVVEGDLALTSWANWITLVQHHIHQTPCARSHHKCTRDFTTRLQALRLFTEGSRLNRTLSLGLRLGLLQIGKKRRGFGGSGRWAACGWGSLLLRFKRQQGVLPFQFSGSLQRILHHLHCAHTELAVLALRGASDRSGCQVEVQLQMVGFLLLLLLLFDDFFDFEIWAGPSLCDCLQSGA